MADIEHPVYVIIGRTMIIISRKLALTKSTPGNNLENLFVALGLSNVLFMIGIGANDYHCAIINTANC
jgi:hypothetical protein